MSNWLSVFGRDYSSPDPCIENLYGVCFDGLNTYAINGTGILGPDSSGGTKKMWVSVWVKDMSTAAQTSGESIFSQGISGNTNNDWFRMSYRTQSSGGAARNQIELEWRANGTTNRARRFYRLHSSNSTTTGSTSTTDYWIDGNTNINTNTDGFVHLLWIMDLPQTGTPINTGTTNFDLYWNGQLMTATHAINMAGTSQVGNLSNSDLSIGRDIATGGGYWKGMLDELFVVSKDQSGPFMTTNGLTTNQDIADYLWNTGCPGDIGNDNRWNFNWWRFENNWNARSGTNAWSPINSPAFGSFPNGCSFSPPALSCTTNILTLPAWHTTNPFPTSGSDSTSVKTYLEGNFTTTLNGGTWNTTSANGSMAWLVIGKSCNSSDTSNAQTYIGDYYWIKMKTNDGDGSAQNLPSVNGGTSNPNVLYLEERDSTTGALTGNIIEFQCIKDAVSINSGTDFIWKAVCTDTDFTNNNTCDGFTTGVAAPKDANGNTTGEYCVTWSSTTPIQTINVENEFTTDFNY